MLPVKLIWKAHTTFSAPVPVNSTRVTAATATQGDTAEAPSQQDVQQHHHARCETIARAW